METNLEAFFNLWLKVRHDLIDDHLMKGPLCVLLCRLMFLFDKRPITSCSLAKRRRRRRTRPFLGVLPIYILHYSIFDINQNKPIYYIIINIV